jgi:large subunit ribosomal protein L23
VEWEGKRMTETNKDPRDIIIAPVVSEKSYNMIDDGKYTFVVDPRANKTEIKLAIEKIFNVKVNSVNTLHRQGKTSRNKYGVGKRKDTKRAIVTLKSGSIDIFTAVG